MNRKGFVLLEGLIAAGILALFVIAVLTVQSMLNSGIHSGESSHDYALLLNRLAAIFSTEQTCRTGLGGAANLGTLPPTATANWVLAPGTNPVQIWEPFEAPVTSSPYLVYSATTAPYNKVGEWTITNLVIDTGPAVPVPNSRLVGVLRVGLQRIVNGTPVSQQLNDIQLSIELGPANQIVSCSSLSFATQTGINYRPYGVPVCGPNQALRSDGVNLTCIQITCPATKTPNGIDPLTGGLICI